MTGGSGSFKFLTMVLPLLFVGCESTTVPTPANSPTIAPFAGLTQTERNQMAAQYNVQLGLGYLKQGNKSLAKQKLMMALSQDPENPVVLDAMGYYWEAVDEPKQAEIYYQKAVSIAPHSGMALNNYGAFLCREGQFKDSLAYFLKAVRDPNYNDAAGAYENAGVCAMQAQELPQAQVYFKKALNYDVNRPLSWYELAKLEAAAGDLTDASHAIDEYLKYAPPSKDVLLLGIEIAKKQGDSAKAASYEAVLYDKFGNVKG